MNNVALGFDYKLSINMLMKQLYIAVQYFYILSQITLEEHCHVVYASSANTKSECLTKIIDGELIATRISNNITIIYLDHPTS